MTIGLGLGLTFSRSRTFSPLSLFASGEPGVWYDPSDLTTLFQDTAGTTPVTTPGQSVALMLDKSGNDHHATQPTAAARPTYGIVPETGRRNLLGYTEGSGADSAPIGYSWLGGGSGEAATTLSNGIEGYELSGGDRYLRDAIGLTATSYTFSVFIEPGATYSGKVIEVSGFTGATGVLSATVSDADESGRVSITFTVDAGDLGGDVRMGQLDASSGTLSFGGWQLEEGSTATAYQKVVDEYDITEAGVPSLGYLSFDGVDDSMVTPTITPGTDKVQVFAGVRQLPLMQSAGIVLEYSTLWSGNNGTFVLFNNIEGQVPFGSNGTTTQTAIPLATQAPVTQILAGLGDISGNLATLRIDGTQVAQNANDQGTGNYLAYPMYIGARAGTSIPFNGHIYSLITRFGANLDAPVIGKTETYIAQKTGVDLT